jgi:hypothetical protein
MVFFITDHCRKEILTGYGIRKRKLVLILAHSQSFFAVISQCQRFLVMCAILKRCSSSWHLCLVGIISFSYFYRIYHGHGWRWRRLSGHSGVPGVCGGPWKQRSRWCQSIEMAFVINRVCLAPLCLYRIVTLSFQSSCAVPRASIISVFFLTIKVRDVMVF